MSKSSTLNLYDALSGEKHLQASVKSDSADLSISSVPLTVKGTVVNIANHNGHIITSAPLASLIL